MQKLFISIIVSLVCFSAMSATSPLCPGEEGYYYTNDRNKNPTMGGFVSYDADIEDNIWVGRNAAICGFAQVTEHARVSGRSVVCGYAKVKGRHVRISGHAKVCGNAVVDGRQNKIEIYGYTKLNSGYYKSGVYNQTNTVRENSFKSKENREVNTFINFMNNYKSTYYYHHNGGYNKDIQRRVKLEVASSTSDPCFVRIKFILEERILPNRNMYVDHGKVIKTTQVNLGLLSKYVVGLTKNKSLRSNSGDQLYYNALDEKKEQRFEDVFIEYFDGVNDSSPVMTERNTADAFFFYEENKQKANQFNEVAHNAIEACQN